GKLVSTRDSLADDVAQCLRAVAPGGVHLQVAAVVGAARARQPRILQRGYYLRAAQKVAAQAAPAVDLRALAAPGDGLLDGCRGAGLQHFENDPGGGGTDIRDFPQRSAGLEERFNWRLERQNRRGRAFVAPHLLLPR